MAELKLNLKKLDQISNRLDLLEKKIETPDRKKPPPEMLPNKVEAVSYTHLTLPTILLV